MELTGEQLPKQLQPWIGTGVVRADASPPRLAIERSIKDRGFSFGGRRNARADGLHRSGRAQD
jgi:hypothetical protein